MAGGRPTKYNSAMCDKVICLAAETGASKHEMAKELGISWSMFQDYEKAHPEFSVAVKEAVASAQAFWEKKLREATLGVIPNVNATLMIFTMKNRFKEHFGDMTKIEHSGKLNINTTALTDEELLALIETK